MRSLAECDQKYWLLQRLPELCFAGLDMKSANADYLFFNCSQNLIIGIYMIVFGLAIALLGMPSHFYSFPLRCHVILTAAADSKSLPKFRDTPTSSSPSLVVVFVCYNIWPLLLLPNCLLTNLSVYILIGGLLLGDKVISNIAGGIVGIAGIGYVGLEFVPLIEPPSSMREADGGWGAEQV